MRTHGLTVRLRVGAIAVCCVVVRDGTDVRAADPAQPRHVSACGRRRARRWLRAAGCGLLVGRVQRLGDCDVVCGVCVDSAPCSKSGTTWPSSCACSCGSTFKTCCGMLVRSSEFAAVPCGGFGGAAVPHCAHSSSSSVLESARNCTALLDSFPPYIDAADNSLAGSIAAPTAASSPTVSLPSPSHAHAPPHAAASAAAASSGAARHAPVPPQPSAVTAMCQACSVSYPPSILHCPACGDMLLQLAPTGAVPMVSPINATMPSASRTAARAQQPPRGPRSPPRPATQPFGWTVPPALPEAGEGPDNAGGVMGVPADDPANAQRRRCRTRSSDDTELESASVVYARLRKESAEVHDGGDGTGAGAGDGNGNGNGNGDDGGASGGASNSSNPEQHVGLELDSSSSSAGHTSPAAAAATFSMETAAESGTGGARASSQTSSLVAAESAAHDDDEPASASPSHSSGHDAAPPPNTDVLAPSRGHGSDPKPSVMVTSPATSESCFCSGCGVKIGVDMRFCWSCGAENMLDSPARSATVAAEVFGEDARLHNARLTASFSTPNFGSLEHRLQEFAVAKEHRGSSVDGGDDHSGTDDTRDGARGKAGAGAGASAAAAAASTSSRAAHKATVGKTRGDDGARTRHHPGAVGTGGSGGGYSISPVKQELAALGLVPDSPAAGRHRRRPDSGALVPHSWGGLSTRSSSTPRKGSAGDSPGFFSSLLGRFKSKPKPTADGDNPEPSGATPRARASSSTSKSKSKSKSRSKSRPRSKSKPKSPASPAGAPRVAVQHSWPAPSGPGDRRSATPSPPPAGVHGMAAPPAAFGQLVDDNVVSLEDYKHRRFHASAMDNTTDETVITSRIMLPKHLVKQCMFDG